MLEMLVLFMCAKEVECTQMSKAYLAHNQQLRQSLKLGSKKATKLMGKEAALATAISYGSLVQKKLKVRLPYSIVAEWKFKDREPKEVSLGWRYDF